MEIVMRKTDYIRIVNLKRKYTGFDILTPVMAISTQSVP